MGVRGEEGVVKPVAKGVGARAGERGGQGGADRGVGVEGREEREGWAVGVGEGGESRRDGGV